jgi:uncharacterized protein (DUF2164 family)
MNKIKLNKERHDEAIKSIQAFFFKERDEELSDFQASIFYDFILNDIGVYIYNQAVADSHQLMTQRIEDIFALEKQPKTEVRR